MFLNKTIVKSYLLYLASQTLVKYSMTPKIKTSFWTKNVTYVVKVQLEMLQMDLEDNETAMSTFDSQVEELRGTVALLESQLTEGHTQRSEMEAKLEDSQAQVAGFFEFL